MSAFSSFLQSPCNSQFKAIQSAILPTRELSANVNHRAGLFPLNARVVKKLTDEHPKWMSEDHKRNMYPFYSMETTYHTRGHKVQLPIASGRGSSSSAETAATSVVVSLTNGTATRNIRLVAQRVGKPPKMPIPKDYDDGSNLSIKATLLDYKILPTVPERDPDGTEIFRTVMDIKYALSRPPIKGEKMRIGFNPWDNLGLRKEEIIQLSGADA